jgi:cytochrome c peroxidase
MKRILQAISPLVAAALATAACHTNASREPATQHGAAARARPRQHQGRSQVAAGIEAPQATSSTALAAGPSALSFMPVVTPPFSEVFARLTAEKPAIMQRQLQLMAARYDLSNRPAHGVKMSGGKPIQAGVRVRLPPGVTWSSLAAMSPAEIRDKELWPGGFYPLPHTNQAEGGFVFPHFQIEETKRQEGRDLARFDLDFDLPDQFLPEFPPPLYLTSRPDLGDVSHRKLVNNQTYFELFDGILNPKDLDGLRLLVTPFPQQQFNLTDDRRSVRPSIGASCFDCHTNGHTNGAYHLAPDGRPEAYRHRINTPTLRGLNMQRLFGSQRALKTVEDFTEFEQRGAYFDGDVVIATKKGVNVLEPGSQVANMTDFQELLDFPPAPRLRVSDKKLDPALATPAEMRGQAVFFGKGQCANCHAPPIYSDNFSHDLRLERFFTPREINGRMAVGDGPIKTFPLRGIKDSPPYLHDGRLLTLEDTVEFFNLVLELKLDDQEKTDLVAFMRAL